MDVHIHRKVRKHAEKSNPSLKQETINSLVEIKQETN